MKLTVNGVIHDWDVEEDMPCCGLARYSGGITGPKYWVWPFAQCGACTGCIWTGSRFAPASWLPE